MLSDIARRLTAITCSFPQIRYRNHSMRSNRTEGYSTRLVAAWLTFRVHIDALLIDPKAYLTATKWWIKRKRVRARGQFAPLLSRSPKAYQLWAIKQDMQQYQTGREDSSLIGQSPIIALIDARNDNGQLATTLRCLSAQGIAAWVIGSPRGHDLLEALDRIDWSGSPWVMSLVAGDKIACNAASTYRTMIAELGAGQGSSTSSVRLLYADDDLLNVRGRRSAPHFKPDWNSELFRHVDYLTGACVVRAEREDLQAVAEASDWAQQLVARMAGAGEVAPVHVRQMLHHRHARMTPTIPIAPDISTQNLPSVTIVIPTRNRVDLLRTCLEGIAATDYPDVDVIIVDNDSDDPQTLAYLAALNPARHQVLRHAGPFNYSAINNRAAKVAQGRLLCLLNNDIEVMDPDWLAKMAVQALREDVGAVGACLLYPDGRIQHAGVVIGVGNAAGHAHRFVHPDEEGYFQRHALPQFTSAVTAACLVVQRERFFAAGGLDEENFPVAFNDVDLCLRLNQHGWQSFYEPRATLIHHESVSRGLDQDPIGAARFAGELAALKRIWKTDEIVDPWHHPQLSRASERFAVAV